MKKLFIITLMCVSCSFLIGQTYFYQFEFFVNSETGVKGCPTNPTKLNKYITFTNNKQICYISDENGIATEKESSSGIGYGAARWVGGVKYNYIGEKNGRYIYEAIETMSSYGGSGNVYTGERGGYFKVYDRKKYLCFSSDYSRLNSWSDPYYYLYPTPNNTIIKMEMDVWRDANMKNQSYSIYVYNKSVSPKEKMSDPGATFY